MRHLKGSVSINPHFWIDLYILNHQNQLYTIKLHVVNLHVVNLHLEDLHLLITKILVKKNYKLGGYRSIIKP